MADEVNRLIAGKRLAPESDRADGSGLSIRGEDTHHMAARIAQKLRDAGLGCAIVHLVPVETANRPLTTGGEQKFLRVVYALCERGWTHA